MVLCVVLTVLPKLVAVMQKGPPTPSQRTVPRTPTDSVPVNATPKHTPSTSSDNCFTPKSSSDDDAMDAKLSVCI